MKFLIIILLVSISCGSTKQLINKEGYYIVNSKNVKRDIQKLIENKGVDNIKGLNISNNNLKILPVEISYLTNLTSLDLSDNMIQELPDFISDLGKMEFLNLNGNNISELPANFNKLVNLKSIIYLENKLTQIEKNIIVCDLPSNAKIHFIKEESLSIQHCDN